MEISQLKILIDNCGQVSITLSYRIESLSISCFPVCRARNLRTGAHTALDSPKFAFSIAVIIVGTLR